jgi:hypothetical protein
MFPLSGEETTETVAAGDVMRLCFVHDVLVMNVCLLLWRLILDNFLEGFWDGGRLFLYVRSVIY